MRTISWSVILSVSLISLVVLWTVLDNSLLLLVHLVLHLGGPLWPCRRSTISGRPALVIGVVVGDLARAVNDVVGPTHFLLLVVVPAAIVEVAWSRVVGAVPASVLRIIVDVIVPVITGSVRIGEIGDIPVSAEVGLPSIIAVGVVPPAVAASCHSAELTVNESSKAFATLRVSGAAYDYVVDIRSLGYLTACL